MERDFEKTKEDAGLRRRTVHVIFPRQKYLTTTERLDSEVWLFRLYWKTFLADSFNSFSVLLRSPGLELGEEGKKFKN